MIKQSKALRYGVLIGVLSLWVDTAQATPVMVNSGQHSGFVRLVFPVLHPSHVSVKIEEDKVILSFPKELSIDFHRVNGRLPHPVFPHFVTNGPTPYHPSVSIYG